MTAKAPASLTKVSQKLYLEIANEYDIVESPYLAILEEGLLAHDRCLEAAAILKKEGLTIRDDRGVTRPHPMLRVEQQARTAMLQALKMLPFDPAPPVRAGHGLHHG